MDGDPREIELKFLIDPPKARALLAHLPAGAAVRPRSLTSIYFDTPGRTLWRAGFTLRLRRDGDGWTQTVKSRGDRDGGFGRGEWETPIAADTLDLAALRATPAGVALGDGTPAAAFEVTVRRRTVTAGASGFPVEFSLDAGRVTVGSRSARFEELELELKSGAVAELLAVARDLQRRFDLGLSFQTKADRGFALIDGRGRAARHFEAPMLSDRMTVGEAFKAIARPCVRQIAGNATLVAARPSAGAIHQMRVGARRLRGALSAFEPILAGDELDRLEADLRWLAGELDPARNLDVLLVGAIRRAARRGGAAALAASVKRQRDAAHARARLAADSARPRLMLLNALGWIEDGSWTLGTAPHAADRDAPIGPFAARVLEKARRKVQGRARHFARLDRPNRHRVRIAAKRLRYMAEAFAGVFGRRRRAHRFIAWLETLLKSLGDLNDIATGETLIGAGPAAESVKSRERGREVRLVADAADALKRLAKSRRFWPKT